MSGEKRRASRCERIITGGIENFNGQNEFFAKNSVKLGLAPTSDEIELRTMKAECIRMKSVCADEMKSVLLPPTGGFHHEVISCIGDGFIPSARTDFVEKSTDNVDAFSWWLFGEPVRTI